jgi:hypothetical protein
MLAEMTNFLYAQAESIVGLPGTLPRFPMPEPPTVLAGPTTFNNFQIDRSVIGSINTGIIEQLDVALENVSIAGDEEVTKAFKELGQAILNARDLKPEDKELAANYLSVLANMAALPKNQPLKDLGMAALAGLERIINLSASLATLYAMYKPPLHGLF